MKIVTRCAFAGRVTATVLFVIAAHALPARASIEMFIGGTAWYCWWKPAWSDGKKLYTFVTSNGINYRIDDSVDFTRSGNFLGGPMLGFRFFGRLEVSAVGAAGRYTFRSQGITKGATLNLPAGPFGYLNMTFTDYEIYSREVTKWDVDVTAAYIVTPWLRVFAGYKNQGYLYEELFYQTDLYRDFLSGSLPFIRRRLSNRVDSNGTGIGVGFTAPLPKNFYIMMNMSCLALWSRDNLHVRDVYLYRSTGTSVHFIPDRKNSFISYGGSASVSLAYHITAINTTVSIGGRYQVLRNRQRYGNDIFRNDVTLNMIDREYDHFAGITLSAVYAFSVWKGAGKPERPT